MTERRIGPVNSKYSSKEHNDILLAGEATLQVISSGDAEAMLFCLHAVPQA